MVCSAFSQSGVRSWRRSAARANLCSLLSNRVDQDTFADRTLRRESEAFRHFPDFAHHVASTAQPLSIGLYSRQRLEPKTLHKEQLRPA